jgi:hypothetical protein
MELLHFISLNEIERIQILHIHGLRLGQTITAGQQIYFFDGHYTKFHH